MLTVKISSKNQITIPKQFLEALGAESGDLLFLQVEERKVIVQPLKKGIIESLVGTVKLKPHLRGIPFEKALKETKKIVAEKLK